MRLLSSLIVPGLVLLAWQLATGLGLVSPYLLPGPGQVLATAVQLIHDGTLQKHLAASLLRVTAGFSLSILLGFSAAAILYRWAVPDRMTAGSLSFLRMTPPLALTPLLILWLGIGDATQIAIIVLAAFFPIYLNTRAGLRRLDAPFCELAASLHVSRSRYILYFLLPAATPQIITGLRLSFGYSWRALIAAELIAAGSGLGYLIMDAEQMQRADEVIVGILAIGTTGWMLDAAFTALSARLLGRRFPELAA